MWEWLKIAYHQHPATKHPFTEDFSSYKSPFPGDFPQRMKWLKRSIKSHSYYIYNYESLLIRINPMNIPMIPPINIYIFQWYPHDIPSCTGRVSKPRRIGHLHNCLEPRLLRRLLLLWATWTRQEQRSRGRMRTALGKTRRGRGTNARYVYYMYMCIFTIYIYIILG